MGNEYVCVYAELQEERTTNNNDCGKENLCIDVPWKTPCACGTSPMNVGRDDAIDFIDALNSEMQ